jgi:hypothetical protein
MTAHNSICHPEATDIKKVGMESPRQLPASYFFLHKSCSNVLREKYNFIPIIL